MGCKKNRTSIKTITSRLWVLGFLLLSSYAAGQSLSSKKPYIKQKSYYQEIPFEYVKGKIIIPVTLDNQVHRFILDTGAPTILSTQIAQKLGIVLTDSLKVSDANETKQQMAVVKIPKLSLSNLDFYDSSAIVYTIKTNDIFDCFQIDGFIGSNLLHHSILQIDHKSKKIRIANTIDKVTINKKSKTKLKLVGNQKGPYIWITLGEKVRNQVLLDTGMEGSYDISMKAHEIFSKKEFYKPMNTGYGAASIGLFGTGKPTIHYQTVIPEITLGNTIFKNVLGETTTDNNSRIGSSFFEQGISTFDFTKKNFYFEPFVAVPDLSETILGFSPTLKNNKLVVGIVWEDELRNQMQSGDEILSVNGTEIESTPICDLFTETSIFKTDEDILLTVRNCDGEIVEISVKRKQAN